MLHIVWRQCYGAGQHRYVGLTIGLAQVTPAMGAWQRDAVAACLRVTRQPWMSHGGEELSQSNLANVGIDVVVVNG